MALPILQNSGSPLALTGGMMLPMQGGGSLESAGQKSWRDGMAAAVTSIYNTLVDIFDVQKDILAVLRGDSMAEDMASERGKPTDTSPDTKQKTTMFDSLKNFQAQSGDMLSRFILTLGAAALIWGNDLEAYVSTVLLPSTIKKFQSLTTFITKIISGIKSIFSAVLDNFARLVKPIKNFLSGKFSLITKITNGIGSFVDVFTNKLRLVSGAFKVFVTKFDIVQKGIAALSTAGSAVANIANKIGKGLASIKGFFSGIHTFVKSFISTSKTVGTIAKTIGPIIKPLMSFIGRAKFIIGKILWPIQILMSIFDFVNGFMKTEGNIAEKFIGGITEVYSGLFMKPLDMLKDLLSWAAKKLGFEDFSKWLDSFSFVDIFKDGVDLYVNFVKNIPYMLINLMKGAVGSVANILPDSWSKAVLEWVNSPTEKPKPFKVARTGPEEEEKEKNKAPEEKEVNADYVDKNKNKTPKEIANQKELLHKLIKSWTREDWQKETRAVLGPQKASRGERNNNPGNIRSSDWTKKQSGYTGADKDGFAIFDKPESGRKAQNQLLSNYGGQEEKGKKSPRGYSLNTVRGIVDKWAPTNENQTDGYIDFVSKKTGFDPDKPLDMKDATTVNKIASAMTIKELGSSSASRFEKFLNKPQLEPNLTVPSAVTSGMSAQAKQAERMQAQIKVAPSVVNAPTNVTNNTVSSGGGILSSIFSRSSSNPSESRAPTVTIGIRG
jgi:hypothetical protein